MFLVELGVKRICCGSSGRDFVYGNLRYEHELFLGMKQ
jgi:hypothetical protein